MVILRLDFVVDGEILVGNVNALYTLVLRKVTWALGVREGNKGVLLEVSEGEGKFFIRIVAVVKVAIAQLVEALALHQCQKGGREGGRGRGGREREGEGGEVPVSVDVGPDDIVGDFIREYTGLVLRRVLVVWECG